MGIGKKVVLVNPGLVGRTMGRYRSLMTPFSPLGLAYLAAILEKRGHHVTVIDQVAEDLSEEAVARRVGVEKPDVVGFTCLTPAVPCVESTVSMIRKASPATRIVAGNIHASYFHREFVQQGIADVVVHGEGESPIQRIVEGCGDLPSALSETKGLTFRRDGEIVFTGMQESYEDLDSLPYPAWHKFPVSRYVSPPTFTLVAPMLLVQSMRGCPYGCYFCSQEYNGQKVRFRNPVSVVDEIEYFSGRLGITFFGFTDAYFPASREKGLAFVDEFMKRGLHKTVSWMMETRVDRVDRDLLIRMKKAGLRIILYGFESGSQEVLDGIGKRATIERAKEVMRYTREAGIYSMGLFMLGLPMDTPETCRQTVDFAMAINPSFAKFSLAVPYPGTRFFEEFKGRLLHTDWEKYTMWAQDGRSSVFIPHKNIGPRRLLNLQRHAIMKFHLRPRVILRHLLLRTLSVRSAFSHFLPFLRRV